MSCPVRDGEPGEPATGCTVEPRIGPLAQTEAAPQEDEPDDRPGEGERIDYWGRQMIVDRLSFRRGQIWLREEGTTACRLYPWPPTGGGGGDGGDGGDGEDGGDGGDGEDGGDGGDGGRYHQITIMEALEAIGAPPLKPGRRGGGEEMEEMECRRKSLTGTGGFWQECSLYRSKGSIYARYRWGRGHKIMGSKHIPGGAATVDPAKGRYEMIWRAVLEDGATTDQVLTMIRSFTRSPKKS